MDFFIDNYASVRPNTDSFPEQNFMEWNEDTYDVLGSVFLRELNDEVGQAGEMKVHEHEYRFDNIAYKMLKDTDFWWLVMEYNEKIDWNVYSDEVLKIPNIDDILVLRDSMRMRQNKADIEKIRVLNSLNGS